MEISPLKAVGVLLGSAFLVSATASPTNSEHLNSRDSSLKQLASMETLDLSRCDELAKSGWAPPATDPDISYNPETGITTILFGEDAIVVDLHEDLTCRELPGIGHILARVVPDYQVMLLEECAHAVQSVQKGDLAKRPEIVLTAEDLTRYIVEACPDRFARDLER